MKKHIVYFMLIATMSLPGMTSCDKISDATTVEKTFTMTIPPTEFTYTDTTTVKAGGFILIYTRPMMFNIADSLQKYGLTGTMTITGIRPEYLTVEAGDGDLHWANFLYAKASNNFLTEGKLFGWGIPGEFSNTVNFSFNTPTGYPSIDTQLTNEQPLAFEIMKSFPYFLQIYVYPTGTVTMPKTVNLIISGKMTIATNIKL